LTSLAAKLPELALATMQVREWRGQVIFRHSVGLGAAEKSWGLHVAKLAGVPRDVLRRAEAVLGSLEARAKGLDPLAEEMPLFARPGMAAPPSHPALEALAQLDLDTLSPREAQEFLYRVKSLLETVAAAPDKLV
jgi:DNA mismatch repair protein MutS